LSPAVALLGCGFAVAAFSLTFTHLAGSSGGPGFEDGPSFSARLKTPAGVAVDAGGNVFISDAGNNTIRMITPADDVTTLAGLAGFRLVPDGLGSAWPSIVLALWTGVYAVVGGFMRGTPLDAGLLVATVGLVAVTPRLRWDERPRTPLGRPGIPARRRPARQVVADIATGRML
jgi:DNA-binding beta-propeller fold protein YncE